MFCLHIVEHIISVDVEFTQDGVQTHFVVVEFAGVDYEILQNDSWGFKVYSESFGSEVGRDWFADLLFGAFYRRCCFPHSLLFSFNRN